MWKRHNKCFSIAVLLLFWFLGGCGGVSKSNLRLLAEEYPTATPAEIKLRLDKLTVEEHVILEFVGKQFKSGVFRKVCEVDTDLRWSWFGETVPGSCARVAKSWQEYVAFLQRTLGPNADLYANETTGRQAILNHFQCKSGEIDAASCALYQSSKSQIDQVVARTSQTIVNNLGNTCTVGVDPNCYP